MINYPAGHEPRPSHKNSQINYGGRGMSFEEQINESNQYYLQHNIAVIHKKPTPIQVVKVSYPKRSAARITEAYYRKASTTDYNGVYQGKYIDFEAKETRNKTHFPLSNFPEHQRSHMSQCCQQGGLAFLLIKFSTLNEVYLVPYQEIEDFLQKEEAQSLTYNFIKKHGYLCPLGLFPMVDYLKALDEYLINDESKEV